MTSLSRKGTYALRAVYALASSGAGEPVLIAELSRRANVPRKFLELILLTLKNAGILRSKKGKGGGYMLARDPADLRLGEIIRVTDGPLVPLPCVGERGAGRCPDCAAGAVCCTRVLMKQVADAVARVVDGTTLAAALEHAARARVSPPTAEARSPRPPHVPVTKSRKGDRTCVSEDCP